MIQVYQTKAKWAPVSLQTRRSGGSRRLGDMRLLTVYVMQFSVDGVLFDRFSFVWNGHFMHIASRHVGHDEMAQACAHFKVISTCSLMLFLGPLVPFMVAEPYGPGGTSVVAFPVGQAPRQGDNQRFAAARRVAIWCVFPSRTHNHILLKSCTKTTIIFFFQNLVLFVFVLPRFCF